MAVALVPCVVGDDKRERPLTGQEPGKIFDRRPPACETGPIPGIGEDRVPAFAPRLARGDEDDAVADVDPGEIVVAQVRGRDPVTGENDAAFEAPAFIRAHPAGEIAAHDERPG